MKWGIVALAIFTMIGCGPEAKVDGQADCALLDSLFNHTDSLEKLLADPTPSWVQIKILLEPTMHIMARNQDSPSNECSYLDHRYRPEKERFLFVDLLSEAAINDTFPEIIQYLVRLRGVFGEDPEIFEYLSEEMAHVGFANPRAYAQYLEDFPEQKKMILNSTRWNPVNVPKLRKKFESIPAGEEIAAFLAKRFPTNSPPVQK